MSVSNVNVGIADGDKLQQGNVPDEKEVLIEQGHTQVTVRPTKSGALGRLKTDDKFRHRFLHTACVCWTMVSLGWRIGLVGPTFPDLRQIIQEDLSVASWIFTAISLGGLIGSVCGGALYDRIDKTVLYVGLTVGFAVFAGVTPWCSNFPAMFAAHTFHGGFASAIDTVITTDMVHVWRMEAGPYLQAAHFAFTIGAIVSPFATEPYLAKRLQYPLNGNELRNVTDFHSSPITYSTYVTSSLNKSVILTDLIPNTTMTLDELELFGETKIYVTYFASAAITLSASVFFIILNCTLGNVYNNLDDCIGSQAKLNHRVYTLSKTWKIVFTLLLSILLMLYCMNERNFIGFLMTFLVAGLGWSKANGATATSVLWTAFACGRFSGIYVVRFMSISSVIGMYIGVLAAGTIGFWLSVIYAIETLVWVSVAAVGIGMSVLFASVFAWMSEKVRRLTGKITSISFVFLSAGSMLMPLLTGYLMEQVSFIWFIYLQFVLVLAMGSLFIVIEIIHRRLIKRERSPNEDKEAS